MIRNPFRPWGAVRIMALEPGRPDPWWPLHVTSQKGCFGRFSWLNSDPAEDAWGQTFWRRRNEP